MGRTMTADPESSDDLRRRAGAADPNALAELFARYRDRLRRMVRLRLDRRLQARIDPSDVLQEAYLVLARRLPEDTPRPPMPFFLWLRVLTVQKLIDIH